jgi:hypothetical protein
MLAGFDGLNKYGGGGECGIVVLSIGISSFGRDKGGGGGGDSWSIVGAAGRKSTLWLS